MRFTLLIQWVVVFVLMWACLLQFAVYRAPDIEEPFSIVTARRLAIAALFVAGVYLAYLGINMRVASKPLVFVLGLFALSHISFAAHRLFPGASHAEQPQH